MIFVFFHHSVQLRAVFIDLPSGGNGVYQRPAPAPTSPLGQSYTTAISPPVLQLLLAEQAAPRGALCAGQMQTHFAAPGRKVESRSGRAQAMAQKKAV